MEMPPQNKKTEAEKRSGRPPNYDNITPPLSPGVDDNTPKAAGGKGYTEIRSPINSLNPLRKWKLVLILIN
jgi:hypothetical protein